MWFKIKIWCADFCKDIVSKFMGKISRRKIIGKHGRKRGRKTIGFEALLRNGSKKPIRCHV